MLLTPRVSKLLSDSLVSCHCRPVVEIFSDLSLKLCIATVSPTCVAMSQFAGPCKAKSRLFCHSASTLQLRNFGLNIAAIKPNWWSSLPPPAVTMMMCCEFLSTASNSADSRSVKSLSALWRMAWVCADVARASADASTESKSPTTKSTCMLSFWAV